MTSLPVEAAYASLAEGDAWRGGPPPGMVPVYEVIAEVMAGDLDPLTGAVRALRAAGVPVDGWGGLAPWSAGALVLIADAVNLAAKEITGAFYVIKPLVWEAVSHLPGVSWGWEVSPEGVPLPGEEGGCFFLAHPDAGTTCAHDPRGQIGRELVAWPSRWSGIYRQDLSFQALGDPTVRRRLALRTSSRLAPHRERWTVARS